MPESAPESAPPEAAPEVTPETEEDIVTLSPFEVVTEKDTGYAATSSLAGSRLNTKLGDIASAISVVTEEFMQDTGSKTIQDVLVYTTNTEVAGLGGNFYGGESGDRNTGYRDRLLAEPHKATRVRGLNTADLTREYFPTDIPMDWYNTTRIDIQRGPNSVLFGLGSPAGIINNTLKAPNLKEQSNWAEVVFSNYGSHREVLDVDVPLVTDQLGIRVVGLNDERSFRRDPTYNDDRRLYGVARWQPKLAEGVFTQVTARFEAGKIEGNRPDYAPPVNLVSEWFNPNGANRLLMDQRGIGTIDQEGNWAYFTQAPANAWWNEGAGTVFSDPTSREVGVAGFDAHRQRGGANDGWNAWAGVNNPTDGWRGTDHYINQKSYYANNPKVLQLINDYETQTGRPFSGFGGVNWTWSTFNQGPFTLLNDSLAGPNKEEWNNFESANIQLTQTFFKGDLGFDFAYDKQDYRYGWDSLFSGNTIGIDVNENFRDGTPNPNVGRAFVFSGSGGNRTEVEREGWRATGYYKLGLRDRVKGMLGNILGDHTFTGTYTDQHNANFWRSYSLHAWDLGYSQSAFSGWTGYDSWQGLHYISDDLRPYASFDAIPASAITGIRAKHEPGSSQMVNYFDKDGVYQRETFNLLSYKTDIDKLYNDAGQGFDDTQSIAFVWQGRMLNDAIIPLFGWREDEYVRWDKPASVVRGDYGVALPFDPSWNYDNVVPLTAKEQRHSWGIVVHTDQLFDLFDYHLPMGFKVSGFYNDSNTFRPSEVGRDIYGNQYPAPAGETKDYGVLVSAFENKVTMRVTHYETLQKNTPIVGTSPDYGWAKAAISRAMNSLRRDTNIQPIPESMVNNWMFGSGNYDAAIAAQPLPTDWQNRPELMGQPLRIRRSAVPGSPTFVGEGDIDPDTGVAYMAPPLDSDESAYRRAWFDARSEAEWSRPVDPAFWTAMEFNQDSNGYWIEWERPANLRTMNDLKSEGLEIEITAQPLANWRVAFNASRTEAKRANAAAGWTDYILNNRDFWNDGIETDATTYWNVDGYADIPEYGNLNSDGEKFGNRYLGAVEQPYYTAVASEGRPVSELRKWHFNLVNNYDFQTGPLKGLGIGGAVRWQDESIIGYYLRYDSQAASWVNNLDDPIMADAETNVDLWISYNRKLSDKLSWHIQLNVRDVFANGDFIPTRANPDGSVAQTRLPYSTSWSLTNSFSF